MGVSPTRQLSLQPVAIGAAVEVTKPLKSSAAGVDGEASPGIEAYGEERWLDELAEVAEAAPPVYGPRKTYVGALSRRAEAAAWEAWAAD